MIITSLGAIVFADSTDVSSEALAETTEKYNRGGYLAFGDSFTRGMGCSDTWEEDTAIEYNDSDHQTRNIPGAYAYLLAEKLGYSGSYYLEDKDANYWPIVHNGLTLAAVMDLIGIEDNYFDDEFYHADYTSHHRRYNKFLEYFGNENSKTNSDELYGKTGTTYDIRDIIADVDLITLQLGMGDILNRPLFTVFTDDMVIRNSDMSIVEACAKIISMANEGYAYFKNAFPLLLEYLTNANPDAKIVIIGASDPAFGIDVSDELDLTIGNLFSVITAGMNSYFEKWAKEYGVIYVDVSNIETASTENDWTLLNDLIGEGYFRVATHPSPTGNVQIVNAILDAISEEEKTVDTNIRVDIGRLPDVDTVFVNGISLGMFSVEDNILTVTCHSKLANNLKIFYTNEDGTTMYTEYQLAYHKDEGYRVYRMYTCNDLFGEIKTALTPFKIIRTIQNFKNQ